MSARATSFYYSFLALPVEKRHAIVAVWDFCRAVDDAVDEPTAGDGDASAECALRHWRDELARLYEGGIPATPQGTRLRPFIERFNLPRSAFADLIDGVAMDLERRRYDTFDALRQYCLRVASAVGLVCGPGEWFGLRPILAKPHLKVLFAGEHIADWQGFMEGAIESGEAAADALIGKPARRAAA